VRASRIAWDAPFEPFGYMACAASPSSTERPNVHLGIGSRSTIGYSRMRSAEAITDGTSSQSKRQSANRSTIGAGSTGRFQSDWAASAAPSGARRSAMKLTRDRPAGASGAVSGYATNFCSPSPAMIMVRRSR